MRIVNFTAAVALAISAAACNRTDTGNELSTETNLAEDSAVNDVLGADQPANAAAPMPADAPGFANAVAASDLFEIESAKLAASKGGSAQVKEFAQHLRTDHEKSSADLKAAAGRVSPAVTVTPALTAQQQGMIDQLRATNGPDFDRRFIDQQTSAHQQALAMLRNYVGAGDAQPLKDFASKSTKMVEGHLEHLNSIRK